MILVLLESSWSVSAGAALTFSETDLLQQCPDVYEPNDGFANAWFISPGALNSYICAANDEDYFKFSVQAGEQIQLDLDNLPDDYNLCLFNPSQGQMACSTNGGKTAESITTTATISGDYYALVYGNQDAYSLGASYTLALTLLEPPDLIPVDVWPESGKICYQVQNIGEQTAPGGHLTSLSVDGQSWASDTVSSPLGPGERINRCFTPPWQCSGSADALIVKTDMQNLVIEGNENNNDRAETWSCDTTPPQIISGPNASNILATGATISWTTQEPGNSLVRFGRYADTFEGQVGGALFVTTHQIQLTSLVPATVYRYRVESTDASGNTAISADRFFETAASTVTSPTLSSFTISRMAGAKEFYDVSVWVNNPLGTRRVEFYMDGHLIGSDYAPGPVAAQMGDGVMPEMAAAQFQVALNPAKMNLSRSSFFSVTHTFMARAYSAAGQVQTSVFYMPPYEPPDINLDVWPRYDRTRYVDTAGGTLPAGSTMDISVHASKDEWECSWVPLIDDMRCADVEHAVDRVEFEVGDVVVHTWRPPTDHNFDHTYTWNVGGLGIGTHTIEVRAFAQDGSSLGTVRRLNVVRGTPSLDLTRSVVRQDNYVRVTLTLENSGTGSAGLTHIRDNVSGFQAIITDSAHYRVVPEYWVETQHCDVEIDVFDGAGPLMLPPGGELVISYLAVPILYDNSDTFGYGAGLRDEVKIWDQGDFCRWRFDRPEPLETEVGEARAASDYLIVTHPRNLILNNPGARDDVDELLSTMAELAQLKLGVLGYLAVQDADSVLGQVRAWGDGMRGSDSLADHFLSNGYLLLVGEVEILGAWTSRHPDIGTVNYTDLPYGNTSGDWVDPELIVGRVVGNNARELITPLRTSIRVYHDEPDYHFTKSRALLASGRGDGVSQFESNLDRVARILRTLGSPFVSNITAIKKRIVEDVDGLNMTHVFTTSILPGGRDLIYYRDHCNAFAWSGVIGTSQFPLNFGERKPFVFACCCQAGRYEALGTNGIAESFLQNEAGVYIGSTENSNRSQNNASSEWFFDRWADSSESIGQSFRALRRHLDGAEGWYWAAEYNLYGDPKYDLTPSLVGLCTAAPMAVTAPITTINLIVPAYEVTSTIQGEHTAYIPGQGGSLLLEKDHPVVPIWVYEVDYAPGYRVQGVELTARSGLTTTTGLSLTMTSVSTDSLASLAAPAVTSLHLDADAAWWPPLDWVMDWSVRDNPDGSETCVIKVYPFYYNAATTNVWFYQNYSLTVSVISSSVQIADITLDASVYDQGDKVSAELSIEHVGDAQDVIVAAVVKKQAGQQIDGLLLQSLPDLTGTASWSLQWDSSGAAAGDYAIEVEITDAAGHVLDRETVEFRIGIVSVEVMALVAAPTLFGIGDTVALSLTWRNNGSVPISGTAVIHVYDENGTWIQNLSHEFVNLGVGQQISFNPVWNTTGAIGEDYVVVGYVLYDSQATPAENIALSTRSRLYLPLVTKQYP